MPAFSTVNAFDYALIGLYFVILIWVALYSARRTKGTGDYFKGGAHTVEQAKTTNYNVEKMDSRRGAKAGATLQTGDRAFSNSRRTWSE